MFLNYDAPQSCLHWYCDFIDAVFSGNRQVTAIALVLCRSCKPGLPATDSWNEHSWRLQQKATVQLEFSFSSLVVVALFLGYFLARLKLRVCYTNLHALHCAKQTKRQRSEGGLQQYRS
jgi:hypothetical protein